MAIYLEKSLIHSTQNIKIAYSTAIESTIKIGNVKNKVISALYRSPVGDKEKFLDRLRAYL